VEVVRLFNAYLETLGLSGLTGDGLQRALTHRSYCAEHPGVESNERLEFLGDSILGAVVGKYVFDRFPSFEEGQLTKLRASVVSTENLSKVSRELGLGELLRLGRGEELSGGREKNSILADAFEAVVGEIYLEFGFSAAEQFVVKVLAPKIELNSQGPGHFDYKSRLQEYLARNSMKPPVYELNWSGPDHLRSFEAVVLSDGVVLGAGIGSSKKLAEQQAAQTALEMLSGTELDGDS
jgi:ribonuclease-3